MNKRAATTGIKPLFAALMLSGLTACSLMPGYQRPEVKVAPAYPGAGSVATTPAGKPAWELTWREFFPDVQLRTLIEAALQNNLDLRQAALRIEEARALYNIQSADMLPNVNLGGSATRAHTPASLSLSGREVTSGNYQVGISLASFEIDYLGRVRSLNAAALNQYLATDEARQAAQISLIAEVAKAALAERAFGEQLELAQRALDGRNAAYKLAKQRFDVGASSALDLRLNETLVLNARVVVLGLQRQRQQALNGLTLLTGKRLDKGLPLKPLTEQGLVTDLPAGLPSELLVHRPDIRAAELRLKAANANIGAARAAFFPRIALTAGYGTGSNVLSGLFDSGSQTWNFVPQMLVPIFDAGRNRSNLTLTEVRKNMAVADYEKTIQVAFREVADALSVRSDLDEQLKAQTDVLKAQQERLRLAEQRHQGGVANFIEVLDAQREVFAAEQALVQARLVRLTNAVDLYRALGGGLS